MKTNIYLIRHAETDWNKEKRYQGQKDIPLNWIGKKQASELADRFHNSRIHLDAIYSSDLERAKETALPTASIYNLEIKTITDLRERCFGKLEGVKVEDLKSQNPRIDMSIQENLLSYDVESFESLKTRIYNTIYLLCGEHHGENIAIVSHGSSINSFLFEISQGTIGSGLTRIKNVSVTTVIFDHHEKNWEIKEFNNVSDIN